jgi:hypothetical protein
VSTRAVRVRIAVVVLVAATVLAASSRLRGAQQASAAQPAGTAAISGIITDATTGQPIGGATVYIRPSVVGPAPSPPVLTDARGRFVFVGLPSTTQYIVSAGRAGYDIGEYAGSAQPAGPTTDRTVPIRVADGETYTSRSGAREASADVSWTSAANQSSARPCGRIRAASSPAARNWCPYRWRPPTIAAPIDSA